MSGFTSSIAWAGFVGVVLAGTGFCAEPAYDKAAVIAQRRSQNELVRQLIDGGADANARSEDGFNLLMSAIVSGGRKPTDAILRQVGFLLAAGADPNALDEQGVSPLAIAYRAGLPAVCDLLKRSGARELDLNSPSTKMAFIRVDLYLLNTSIDWYAVDNSGGMKGQEIPFKDLAPRYTPDHARWDVLEQEGKDPFGGIYRIFPWDKPHMVIDPATLKKIEELTGKPFVVSANNNVQD